MATIEHFKGTLAEYRTKYPEQLVVQTRTKSDLMITARAPGSKAATSVFIPKSLPTDVTRQSPATTVVQSDDFLSLLAREVIILVVPHEGLRKFLKASDDRLRAMTGRDKLDLASIDELTNVTGEEEKVEAVSTLTVNNVERLNRIFDGEADYGTPEAGEALLLECLLSCNEKEKAYIRMNFKHAEVLARVWED